MLYEVRVRDGEGKLKKVLTSKKLSKRHWKLYPEYHKARPGTKKSFNACGKTESSYDPDLRKSGYGDY